MSKIQEVPQPMEDEDLSKVAGGGDPDSPTGGGSRQE